MKLFKYTILISIFTFLVSSCIDDDSSWYPPENDPTGDYKYQSSTLYFERNGKPDPEEAVVGTGYMKVENYLNSADISVVPQLGWTYQLHVSNLSDHTLTDGSTITSFSINQQDIELEYNYYDVSGTGNKAVRDVDGTLIGYFDGYIKSDSLIFELRSSDQANGWTIADYKARLRN